MSHFCIEFKLDLFGELLVTSLSSYNISKVQVWTLVIN